MKSIMKISAWLAGDHNAKSDVAKPVVLRIDATWNDEYLSEWMIPPNCPRSKSVMRKIRIAFKAR